MYNNYKKHGLTIVKLFLPTPVCAKYRREISGPLKSLIPAASNFATELQEDCIFYFYYFYEFIMKLCQATLIVRGDATGYSKH